jgi:hypothetical protein
MHHSFVPAHPTKPPTPGKPRVHNGAGTGRLRSARCRREPQPSSAARRRRAPPKAAAAAGPRLAGRRPPRRRVQRRRQREQPDARRCPGAGVRAVRGRAAAGGRGAAVAPRRGPRGGDSAPGEVCAHTRASRHAAGPWSAHSCALPAASPAASPPAAVCGWLGLAGAVGRLACVRHAWPRFARCMACARACKQLFVALAGSSKSATCIFPHE